jgi:hypothetical protein
MLGALSYFAHNQWQSTYGKNGFVKTNENIEWHYIHPSPSLDYIVDEVQIVPILQISKKLWYIKICWGKTIVNSICSKS